MNLMNMETVHVAWDFLKENGLKALILKSKHKIQGIDDDYDYAEWWNLTKPSEEELEEQIEARKEDRKEQEKLTEDILEAAKEMENAGNTVSDAQQAIKTLMNKMSLVEDDVKGAAVDQGV